MSNQTTTSLPSTTLYFREGSSDKVYQAAVAPSGAGFVVNFAYGRRGAALQAGTKTASPVPLEKAIAVYNKIVAEKTGKGYTPGEDGTPFAGTDLERRNTGRVPQLLNPIDRAEAERLILDDRYIMEEKHDGERVTIEVANGDATGANRDGLSRPLPVTVRDAALGLAGSMVLDGELVGERFHAFDVLALDGASIAHKALSDRIQIRDARVPEIGRGPRREIGKHLCRVTTARTADQKRAMLGEIEARGGEGVVFKLKDAPYAPGRPASGGAWLKLKFVESATCRVAATSRDKRSVAIEMRDGDRWVGVGNVTVPANQGIPAPGSLVEVRYLYAYRGGSLFQPVLVGPRADVGEDACAIATLKFKPENPA